jgi:hypothetical protein
MGLVARATTYGVEVPAVVVVNELGVEYPTELVAEVVAEVVRGLRVRGVLGGGTGLFTIPFFHAS